MLPPFHAHQSAASVIVAYSPNSTCAKCIICHKTTEPQRNSSLSTSSIPLANANAHPRYHCMMALRASTLYCFIHSPQVHRTSTHIASDASDHPLLSVFSSSAWLVTNVKAWITADTSPTNSPSHNLQQTASIRSHHSIAPLAQENVLANPSRPYQNYEFINHDHPLQQCLAPPHFQLTPCTRRGAQ